MPDNEYMRIIGEQDRLIEIYRELLQDCLDGMGLLQAAGQLPPALLPVLTSLEDHLLDDDEEPRPGQ